MQDTIWYDPYYSPTKSLSWAPVIWNFFHNRSFTIDCVKISQGSVKQLTEWLPQNYILLTYYHHTCLFIYWSYVDHIDYRYLCILTLLYGIYDKDPKRKIRLDVVPKFLSICISSLRQTPHNGWITPLTLIVSEFWRLEVQNGSVSRFGSCLGCSLVCRPSRCLLMFFPMCMQTSVLLD